MTEIDPKSKWVGRILIASLAFNVFLGGFIIARTFSQKQAPPSPSLALDLRSLPDGVPPKIREELEENFQDRQKGLQKTYQKIQLTQRNIERIIGDNKFDEEALKKAYKNLRNLNMEIQIPIHEAMIEAARDLNPDRRRILTEFISKQRSRNGKLRRPGAVDGTQWSLGFKDGKIELDVNELKKFSGLKIFKQLENLENIQVRLNNDYENEEDGGEDRNIEREERAKERKARRDQRRLDREKARKDACEEDGEECIF